MSALECHSLQQVSLSSSAALSQPTLVPFDPVVSPKQMAGDRRILRSIARNVAHLFRFKGPTAVAAGAAEGKDEPAIGGEMWFQETKIVGHEGTAADTVADGDEEEEGNDDDEDVSVHSTHSDFTYK